MPDFEIINKSLKAGWVKRFLTPGTQSWKTIPLSLLQAVGGSLLFKCNFSLKTLPDLPFLPQFYKDVLGAWEKIVSHTLKTRIEIKDEFLWNNHLITINCGKSVFYKEWYNAGVRNLSGILNKEGKFMSFSEFTRKYTIKTNFLRYLSFCNAIPASWRETLISGVDNREMNLLHSPSDLGNWTCQYAPSSYISKIFQKPTSEACLIRAWLHLSDLGVIQPLF